jgi:deazaflavin-dependent oxidoreductase (nitroreductase family)
VVDPEIAALDFCYLTTTGRRTGNPHTIEIWFAVEGEVVFLLAGGGDASDWVRNLRANPTVGLRMGDRDMIARARVVEEAEEDGRARELVYAKYAPRSSGLEGWRDEALPIAIDLPQPPPGPRSGMPTRAEP